MDVTLGRVLAALEAGVARPRATYRIQFHAGFTFRDAAALAPYLAALGVSHLYASPYLKARPGSTHGYDIVDHGVLNPEIGSEADYDAMVSALHEHGLGQILDMVPNHMGILDEANRWWLDVLENGPSSPYAPFFDIDWSPLKAELRDKVLLPVLGDQYGQVLENQELRLTFDEHGFWIQYHDRRFPVGPRSVARILEHRMDQLAAALGAPAAVGGGVPPPDPTAANPAFAEYQSIVTAIHNLPPRSERDPEKVALRHREKEVIKRRLIALCRQEPRILQFIKDNVRIFNGTKGEPRSFDLLDELLADQAYRLAYWRVAAEEINYRRFFDVNELAALRMNDPRVFEATHRLVLELLRSGKVQGLRIDHPDGLFDPLGYFQTLQRARRQQVVEAEVGVTAGSDGQGRSALLDRLMADLDARAAEDPASPVARPLFIVVEKILGPDEPLPEQWPVWGTTGYEFLNVLGGLFVAQDEARRLDELYERVIGRRIHFPDLVYECKKLNMYVSMASETNVLGHQLNLLSERNRWSRDFTLYSLTQALREIIACFPVYRTYICAGKDEVSERDRRYVEQAVYAAKRRNPAIDASIFDFIRDVLLLRFPSRLSEEDRAMQREFVMKFQQVTSPVMAKGVEDTAFYRYNRLVALNEVGGEPDRMGTSPADFHRMNQERLARWPGSLSTTSTHDTKRSEDVRARIAVLSEVAREWRAAVNLWRRMNARRKVEVDGRPAPDPNDEYLLYQTLVGSWPLEGASGEALAAYRDRIQQYMAKATREAKVNTSWINPDPGYDDAVRTFVAVLLDDSPQNRFLPELVGFVGRVARFGLMNSLSQTVLKLLSPGVPDIYQGTECWDFSLVDPDNRRPVDFGLRVRLLEEIRAAAAAEGGLAGLAAELAGRLADPRAKLFVVHRALEMRREAPELFWAGAYLPLVAEGAKAQHVVAFARHRPGGGEPFDTALAVVPRLTTRLVRSADGLPVGPDVWGDTFLPLPAEVEARVFVDRFTGERLEAEQRNGRAGFPMARLLSRFPVAALVAAGGASGR